MAGLRGHGCVCSDSLASFLQRTLVSHFVMTEDQPSGRCAPPQGYSGHVYRRVCDAGAMFDRQLMESSRTTMASCCEDGCVAALLQGCECKALRRTSCVQTWLPFFMRMIFIFGRHTSLYPSALKISLAYEACLCDLRPESVNSCHSHQAENTSLW